MDKKGFTIWGTGDRSCCFSESLDEKPMFYLDNDIRKKGMFFFDREICHPSDISHLGQYFIIIANSYYDEIKKQLLDLGLKENEDFIYYQKIENNVIRLERLASELRSSIVCFKERYADFKNTTLIFGSMISFDTNSYKLYNEAYEKIKKNFLMISETHAIEDKAKLGMIKFPYFCLPLMLWQNFHLIQNDFYEIHVDRAIIDYIEEKDYRKAALTDFKGKNRNMAHGYGEHFIYYADFYIREMLDYIQPGKVLIWNQFYPFHILINAICKEKNIDILYMEYGVLPGTYLVERKGQMGESYPAVCSRQFQELKITNDDIIEAEKVYEYLHESGINRKEQPRNDEIEEAKKRIDNKRPIIVYTGQNDYESGLYPYTEKTKKYHSPIFRSSNDAALFLAEISERNGWNFIYKPHPLCADIKIDEIKLPDRAIVIEKCNINELLDWADVNITILSTTGYISLIRKKPTVMLGYTQLRDKGCNYQAFSMDAVEGEIVKALQWGYTKEQEKAFVRHIARLLKYYLYDDMKERNMRFGKKWESICLGETIAF